MDLQVIQTLVENLDRFQTYIHNYDAVVASESSRKWNQFLVSVDRK